MTRKKVKLVWIVNDSARKASLKKRRVGLLKKVSELTTLCGVNALVIIFSPDEKEPAMWPSRPVVQQLLARFHSLPEMERCKKMMNQEIYLKERVTKVQEQLKKLQRRNKEMDVSHLMHQLYQGKRQDEFNVHELHGLCWFAEEKKKEIKKRIDYFQQVNALPAASLPPPGPAPGEETARTGGDGRTTTESILWDQWFIDMMNCNDNNIAAGSSNSRVSSDLEPSTPQQTFATAANQMGLPHGNVRAFFGSCSGATDHMGLPYGNINIGDGGCGGNDVGLGLQPSQNDNNNAEGDESSFGLPSDQVFGGSIAGSDVGLPFDVTKQWPKSFYR